MMLALLPHRVPVAQWLPVLNQLSVRLLLWHRSQCTGLSCQIHVARNTASKTLEILMACPMCSKQQSTTVLWARWSRTSLSEPKTTVVAELWFLWVVLTKIQQVFSCSHVFPCSNRHAHTSSDLRSSTWSRLPMHRKVMLQRWTQTKRFIWSFWAGLYVAKLSGKSFIWGTIGFIGFANLFGKVRLHAQWILEVFLLGWQESKAQRGQPCLTSFRAFGTQLLKSFPIPLTIAKGHDTDMSHSLATMQIQKQNSFHPGLSWTTSRCFSTNTLSVLYLTSFSLVVGPVILGIDSGFEKIQNMSNVQLAHVTSWY